MSFESAIPTVPVVLWAVAPTRLYLDGEATFSAPEAPRRFDAGEHVVRIVAPEHEPLELKVRLDPHTPALLHAQLDPSAGVTLVRFGAACASCPDVLAEETLEFEPSAASSRPDLMLAQAAHALRRSRRPEAAQALRHIPPADRRGVLFTRLAVQVLHDTFQRGEAERLLRGLTGPDAADLPRLLESHAALVTKEADRRDALVLERWNRLTERFTALIERYGARFPGPTGSASRRLGALSVSVEDAMRKKDLGGVLEAVVAAESSLVTLFEQLKSLEPTDCDFHAEVVATVSG